MAFLADADVWAHLRLVDSAEETDLVWLYVDAACEWVSNLTGKDYSVDPLPRSVYAAALLVVSDLYENREASSPVELKENPAVLRLLAPYRAY